VICNRCGCDVVLPARPTLKYCEDDLDLEIGRLNAVLTGLRAGAGADADADADARGLPDRPTHPLPVSPVEVASSPPLLGRWHHGQGFLVSGTIRIAHWDCETNPPTEFQDQALQWICDSLNAAVKAYEATAPDEFEDEESQIGSELPDAAHQAHVLTSAAVDVLTERRRQIESEGWTPSHDDQQRAVGGQLATASACYALSGAGLDESARSLWPWGDAWWKPRSRRQDLVRSCALGLAEIERIDRAAIINQNRSIP
jgi:hypothetical protein